MVVCPTDCTSRQPTSSERSALASVAQETAPHERRPAERIRSVMCRVQNSLALYTIFKFIHVLGAVILVGNVTVTAVWKVFADRTHDAKVVAFGQRLVTITDWSLTVGGIVLIIVGGYGAAFVGRVNLFEARWLLWSQILFAVSGIMWAGILIPAQIRQARMARAFASGGEIPAAYRRDARLWLWWGIIATIPLVIALWLMVVKPV